MSEENRDKLVKFSDVIKKIQENLDLEGYGLGSAEEAAIKDVYNKHPEIFTEVAVNNEEFMDIMDLITYNHPSLNDDVNPDIKDNKSQYLDKKLSEFSTKVSIQEGEDKQEREEKAEAEKEKYLEEEATEAERKAKEKAKREQEEQEAKEKAELMAKREAEAKAKADEAAKAKAEVEAKAKVEAATSSMRKNIEGIRSKIIKANVGDSDYTDLTNDFAWMDTDIVSTLTTSSSKTKNAIPSIYAIEYEQTISSVLSNMINNINIGINGIGNIMDSFNTLINRLTGTNDSGGATSTPAPSQPEGDTSIFGKLAKYAEKYLKAGNITEDMVLLAPYQYLYATKATGKRFVFPFLDDNVFPSITGNNWGDTNKDDTSMIFSNPLTDFISTAAEALAYVATDMMNISNIGSDTSAAAGTVMEMAKAFKYPKEGSEIKVQFTLFNTVIKNNSRAIWKKHFKFLYLFSVRNMPWKITASSFLPPLLYDIIIPGQKRLPLSYVKSIAIQSKGIIRKLSIDNFIDSEGGSSIDVNVPEAWVVTITFKSLIADNANLMVSGVRDLKITTS